MNCRPLAPPPTLASGEQVQSDPDLNDESQVPKLPASRRIMMLSVASPL